MRNAKRYQRSTRERGKTMKGPKAVSWFSRCRAGLAATNGDEEPWTCPPHASMVRDRKLLLLPLVNPLCFSPLFPPIFSSFFPPSPSLLPSSSVIEQADILRPILAPYSLDSVLLDGRDLFSLSHSFHDRKSSCCILFTEYRYTREPRYLLLLLLLNKLENILDFEPKEKGYQLIHFFPQADRRSRIAETT